MRSRSSVVILAIVGLLVFSLGVAALNYLSLGEPQDDEVELRQANEVAESRVADGKRIQTEPDFELNNKSAISKMNSSEVNVTGVRIKTYKISINKDKKKDVLVREAGQGNFHVLLLHGENFSSIIWQTIGTLRYLSSWGYRVIAIDIPKRGNSSLPVNGDREAARWLTKLIQALDLSNLVVISPCSSGELALPYIFQLKNPQQRVRAFVPIAPVGTERFPNDDYRQVNIPTLIVHAEKDSPFQPAYELLLQIPNSEVLFMIDAGHDSYVDQPKFFHQGLRRFLYNVYRPSYEKSL